MKSTARQQRSCCGPARLPATSITAARRFRKNSASGTIGALLGHNMGIWVHEDPMLVAGDERELQEGMIVVLEPRFYGYQIQDVFQITSGGPLLLSDRF